MSEKPHVLTPISWEMLDGLLPPLSAEEEVSLRKSIGENGVLDPVKILPDGRIIDGNHRWRLSKGKAPVEVLDVSEEEALRIALKLNVSRRHLSPDQKRELVLTLRKRRFSQERVARLTGFSRAYVSSLERLEDFSDAKTVNSKPPDLRIKIPEAEHERIYERSKGEPLSRLAADYKVTPGRISQILQHREKELEREVALEELERRAVSLHPLEAQFSTIVLDPPWPAEGEYDPKGRRGTPPYPVMTVDEIKGLKVPSAADCSLWLWTTNTFLHEAFHVLESWGFAPKSILTWAKNSIGLGKWLRGQTEHCILAVKGSPKIVLAGQSTLLRAPSREHSRKPDEFYILVDSLCEGPKLDYFGRERRDGWTVYGTSG
jgi:N6-adenosine-specific RNA methylase IME4